jgi:hypothetical protein
MELVVLAVVVATSVVVQMVEAVVLEDILVMAEQRQIQRAMVLMVLVVVAVALMADLHILAGALEYLVKEQMGQVEQ